MPASIRSPFFEFLNRRDDQGFDAFMNASVEDRDYINWNQYVLPYDFGDAEFEYRALRNSCAIGDVTPMCKIRVRGADAGRFLDHLVTRPVSQLGSMRTTYIVFCNDDGSLKDDAVLYKIADDDYVLMPSDIDHTPYFETLRKSLGMAGVTFELCNDDWCGLAIQGPRSAAVMQQMGFDEVETLAPFAVREYERNGDTLRVARMGFTADLGYELWCNPGKADTVMELVREARNSLDLDIPGYGLSVIDTCRMEGGFVVAGWDFATELDPEPGLERSPFEVGLGWLVNLDACEFPGIDALRKERENGSRFAFRTFSLDEKLKLDDRARLHAGPGEDEALVGIMTSASWSWGLEKTLGNVSIDGNWVDLDSAWVRAGDRWVELTLLDGPLLALDYRNQVPAPTDQDV